MLTPRQQQILEFIRGYSEAKGFAPSLQEIQSHLGLASVATVHKHVKNLQDRGALRREFHRSRALEVVDESTVGTGVVELPLMGLVAAGLPIEAIDPGETIRVPEDMVGRARTFVLKVRGDSMIEDCIQDGDFVIVEERITARNGEMVVACIGSSDVTLKRFYREGDRVRLQPANPRFEPILVSDGDFRIQGVVVGVLRRY